MKNLQSLTAVLCVLLMIPGWSSAQETRQQSPQLDTERPHWYSSFTNPYQPRVVPPVNVSNSGRLDSLLRAGKLYLSLSDAIALALENNLDIEVLRYEFSLANTDVQRAKAGASILGIPTQVTSGMPTGSNPVLGTLQNAGLPSTPVATSLAPGVSFDPTLNGTLNWAHNTTPQQNTVTTGTTALVSTNKVANVGISQGFITGGTATLGYNNFNQVQNAYLNAFDPATQSNLDLSITQPLLQGFGIALNNRTIRIARNNLKAADFVFKQQVINTVANTIQLYWNLVFFNGDVEVKKKALALAEKLQDDNKKQVEIGTLAPIEIIRAQAQVASSQQAVVQAQTNVLQQETVLKSALSRNGLASPAVAEATVVPTDPIRIPEVEAIEPIQDLIGRALDNRPELAQSRIQIDNAKIALTGTRNQMLPSLNLVADVRNNALVGSPNTLPIPPGSNLRRSSADPFFVGGYSGVLSQLFSRNFPTYGVGLQLNIPLRNRAQQANMITAELNLRQNELAVQREINQIRVDVQNGLIAVQQARAQYQAATQARVLAEQTLDAEQKKLAVGASTPFLVIQAQRDLATAADTEVQAQAQYALARNQLDLASGMTLENNHVEFDEAKAGRVSKAPDALPAINGNNR
jgi:outer membrane protein